MPTFSIAMNIGALYAQVMPQSNRMPVMASKGFEAHLAATQRVDQESRYESLLLSTYGAPTQTGSAHPRSPKADVRKTATDSRIDADRLALMQERAVGLAMQPLSFDQDAHPGVLSEPPMVAHPPGVEPNLAASLATPPGFVQHPFSGEELMTVEPNAQSKTTDLPAIQITAAAALAAERHAGSETNDEAALQKLLFNTDLNVKVVRVDAPQEQLLVDQPSAQNDPAIVPTRVAVLARETPHAGPSPNIPSVAMTPLSLSSELAEITVTAQALEELGVQTTDDASQSDDQPSSNPDAKGGAARPELLNAAKSPTGTTEGSKGESPTDSQRDRRESAYRLVADRIEVASVLRSRNEVTMHLDPFDLGEIKLMLSQKDGGIEAKVFAQDERVRQVLASGQGDFAKTLDSRGVRLDSFQVNSFSAHTGDRSEGSGAPTDHHHPRFASYSTERPTTHSAPVRIRTTALDLAI